MGITVSRKVAAVESGGSHRVDPVETMVVVEAAPVEECVAALSGRGETR
jgi:hypothetical protein